MPELGQSQYDFKYLTFPSDLGMDYVGHYMVININVPTQGFTLTAGRAQNTPAAGKYAKPNGSYFTVLDPTEGFNNGTKVDSLRFGNKGVGATPVDGSLASVGAEITGFGYNLYNKVTSGDNSSALLAIPRQSRRIAESIALFMPQDVTFIDANEYENIELSSYGKSIGVFGLGALGGFTGAFVLSSLTGGISKAMQLGGNPINPAVEVLFSTKRLRTFDFTFLFAPRNEAESENLKGIIKTLRFHASPELNYAGFTWIPPADFDITFFKHGQENLNIMRINTCVLEAVTVQYSPSGTYSTFSNGHPVAVQLTLQFRELEPIHKERVVQGF